MGHNLAGAGAAWWGHMGSGHGAAEGAATAAPPNVTNMCEYLFKSIVLRVGVILVNIVRS